MFDWLKKVFSPVDNSQELRKALDALYRVNPESKQMLDKVELSGYPVSIVPGTLKGETLATTAVTHDGAIITVDLLKVRRAHDSLVPVLAHEIFHAHEAFVTLGVDEFVSRVERDKRLPWEQRELEISAVRYEDELRWRLITTPEFRGTMAPSRARANQYAKLLR